MKNCDLCNSVDLMHYRVKFINYKNWIFCCKNCWHIVSKQRQYPYGGIEIKNLEYYKVMAKSYWLINSIEQRLKDLQNDKIFMVYLSICL